MGKPNLANEIVPVGISVISGRTGRTVAVYLTVLPAVTRLGPEIVVVVATSTLEKTVTGARVSARLTVDDFRVFWKLLAFDQAVLATPSLFEFVTV
jgi:hypothetical protein